jgi:hypothetical protein
MRTSTRNKSGRMAEAIAFDKTVDKDGNIRSNRQSKVRRRKRDTNIFDELDVEDGSNQDDAEYNDSEDESASSFDGSESEDGGISNGEVCFQSNLPLVNLTA